MKSIVRLLTVSLALASSPALAANTTVITSIKPLHSLAAAVMQGDPNQPLLLVDGKTSPHDFSLKPSQRKALENARIVFYLGDTFETFLNKTLASLPKGVTAVPLERAIGIRRLAIRYKEDWHSRAPGSEGHFDLHLWLSPANAKVMVMEIARQLSIAFPEKRTFYFENARRAALRIDEMDKLLERRMVKLRKKPFIIFHDDIHYFEDRYELISIGSLSTHSAQASGAKHLSDMQGRVRNDEVVCVFRHPSFEGKVVENLTAGTKIKMGVLDAEGALLEPGPELYFQLMEGLAAELERCLRTEASAPAP